MRPHLARGRTERTVVLVVPSVNDHGIRMLLDDVLSEIDDGVAVRSGHSHVHDFDRVIRKDIRQRIIEDARERSVWRIGKAGRRRFAKNEYPHRMRGFLLEERVTRRRWRDLLLREISPSQIRSRSEIAGASYAGFLERACIAAVARNPERSLEQSQEEEWKRKTDREKERGLSSRKRRVGFLIGPCRFFAWLRSHSRRSNR